MILLFQTFNSMGYAGFIKMGVIPSTVEKVFFLWGGSSIKPYYYPYLPICYLIFRKNLQVVWGQRVFGASQLALVVKNPPINAGDLRDEGLISGSGRSPGGGHGNPLQYCCLENSMDRGAWWATVHGITKSRTQLKRLSTCALPIYTSFCLLPEIKMLEDTVLL